MSLKQLISLLILSTVLNQANANKNNLIIVEGFIFTNCQEAENFLHGINSTSEFQRLINFQKKRQERGVEERFSQLIKEFDAAQRFYSKQKEALKKERFRNVAQKILIEAGFKYLSQNTEKILLTKGLTKNEKQALSLLIDAKVNTVRLISENTIGTKPNLPSMLAGRVDFILSALDKIGNIPTARVYSEILSKGILGIDVTFLWLNADLAIVFAEQQEQRFYSNKIKAVLGKPSEKIRELERLKLRILKECEN